MSRLALDYLQRTFKVGCLESLERDMSNGHIFALVLCELGFLSLAELEEGGVVDAIAPEIVLKNFLVVSRGLKSIDIKLTRPMVASIVSEQPGAAANLVMQIKRKVEERATGQSSGAALLKYKESIKTLRPKEFTRAQEKFSQLSPADKYYFDAKNVLDSGVFADVDMRTLLGARYETFRHATDADILRQVEQEEQAKLALRSGQHDATATQRRNFRASNLASADRITTSWETTLETKRQRQIRDLQFELATSRAAQLKGQQRNRIHDKEQIAGIDAFELNLKRSGLGGGDDDGGNLKISYEDADCFINRIEQLAKKRWPTMEDASDFMTQLKLRTTDRKATRYEKARRRRKMLLEQTMAMSALGVDEEESEADAAQTGKQPETASKTKSAGEKEAKYTKMLETGRLSKEAITAKSEEEIRLWAERYRMMADENAEDTAATMQEIMRAREERKMQRHIQNEALCRGMVSDMIGDLFDAPGKQQQQEEKKDVLKPNLTQTSMEFSHQLADLAHSRLNEFSGPVISLADVVALDAWPASATLAANIAKWSLSSSSSSTTDTGHDVLLTGENYLVEGKKGEEKEEEKEEEKLVLVQENSTSVKRCEAFVEVAQLVLETLLERTAAAAIVVDHGGTSLPSNGEPDFRITLGERAEFTSRVVGNTTSAILCLSDGSHVPLSTWNRLISWLGQDVVFLWDSVIALEASVKIRPLMEGKTPTVTFSALVGILLGEHVVCPAEFISFSLPPSVLRACTELVEISTRIMSIQPQIEGGTVPGMPFNDISLAALIGQSLWLRNFFADKVENCPRLAVVGKRFGGGVSVADTVIFARLLEWFLRGGTRDNIPANEVKMQDALQSEADKASGGGGKKKAPPPAKGKGVETSIAEQCSISAAVWIRLHEPKSSAPSDILENPGEQSISDKILDAFALTTWVEMPTFPLDKEELELLEFAKSTFRGADGSPLRPLSVYCLQRAPQPPMQSQHVQEEIVLQEEKSKTQDDCEIEFPKFSAEVIVVKHPIEVAINFTSEISISEAMVSIALLEGGVVLGTADRDEADSDSADEAEKTMQDVIARSLQRVSRIMNVRRGRLSASENVFYLHLTGENVLSMPEAFAAHSLVCEAQALEQELYGVCLLAVEKSVLATNQRMREREAALISELKTGDARWQGLCQATLQVLPSSNNGDAKKIKLALGDLICRLGDVADERHMTWMRRLDQYEHEAADDVSELKDFLLHMSELLCSCTFRILEAKREAALSLSALLSLAAFTEFPWVLPRQAEAGPRMLLDRCRDEVRASALLLSHTCGAQQEEGDSTSWRDLAAVELPQHSNSNNAEKTLSSAALTEVYFESLSVSTALLSATLRGLESCMQGSSDASRRMQDSVRRRHDYEHANLADWGRKLDAQFLAQNIFACSDDVAHDGVEALVGKFVCEAKDMVISLAQVHAFAFALSEDLYSAKQQVVGPEEYLVIDAPPLRSQRDVVVDMALAAAAKNAKHDLTLSRGWRSQDRVESFIRAKLDDARVTVDEPDSLQSRVLFFRGLVSFLVLSAVSSPPSGDALVRLANILGFAPEDRLTAPVLIQKVSSDAKTQSLADAVGAVAYCCLDRNGLVVVDDLLLALCRSPQRLDEGNFFEKYLLIGQGGEGPMAEFNPKQTDLFPCILQDGVCKAFRVAASVKHFELGEEEEEEHVDPALSMSAGAIHLRTICGFTLRPRQVQWLSEQLKLPVPLKCVASPEISFIVRPLPLRPTVSSDDAADPAAEVAGAKTELGLEPLPEVPTEWVPVIIGDAGCSSSVVSSNMTTLDIYFRMNT